MLAPRSLVSGLSALALVLAVPAHAQDTTAHPGSYLFGAGVNLQGGTNAAPALQLGKEWRARDSRFGLRLSAGYTMTNTGTLSTFDFSTGNSAGTFQAIDRTYSVGLGATYALTRGRVQPYLLSGVLIQDRVRSGSTTFAPGTTLPMGVDPATRRFDYRVSDWSLGMEAGVGLQARVGHVWIYSEMRRQLSTGNGAPWIQHPNPLTVGIRF